jgi:PKD repeat protein
MKKGLIAGALLLFGLQNNFAQAQYRICSTDSMMREAKLADPDYVNRIGDLQQFTQNYVQQLGNQKTSGTILYTIPVVFHIIHNYGPENISKAQVLDAVEVLNRSFQKYYSDSVLVASAFRPIIADVQVQFRLAQLDPSGNCTDGITRTVSTLTNSAGDNVKALIDWPRDKYFNVWVVANIASGAAGYAYLPGIGPTIDGVVILHNYTGYIGTNSGSNYGARSLAHEVGHWLNLSHTWGGTNNPGLPQNCSDDDLVQDTPNTIGVSNFSCDTSQVTCSTLDNVQNYMDYAGCHYMFTEGQKARMHATLNSPASQRNNLPLQSNLIATGTNDGYVPTACVPVVDYNKTVKYVCTGETVNFIDLSWRSDPTSWQWDFPGGTPSASADQNPVIQYNTPGVYNVTLSVSNSAGSATSQTNAMIVVSPATGANAIPYTENFENTGPIPSGSDWQVVSTAASNWELSSVAAVSGTKAMRLFNHTGYVNGDVDAFVTPGYNLTNITNANMTFKVAFAARSTNSTDLLKVYASNNCGETWNMRYTKSGLTLSTAGIISGNFTPTASQWREDAAAINTGSYNGKPNVRFKFEFTENTGNNIYIDDINITGTSTVGIKDVEFLATVNLYPNPSREGAQASFNLSEPTFMTIEVTDVAGRILNVLEQAQLKPGNYSYNFGNDYSAGIYFVRFKSGENDLTQKIIFTR